MNGCFSLVGRVGCLVVVLAVGFGVWYFREPLGEKAKGWVGSRAALPSTARSNVGAPTEAALASAREKGESLLESGGPDSVFLGANEAASLVGSGIDWSIRRAWDSLRVELLVGRLVIHARLEGTLIPEEALGPLGGVLQTREPIQMGGAVWVSEPGVGSLVLDEFQIRGIPFPRQMVGRLAHLMAGASADGNFAIAIPETVAFIRVSPEGMWLVKPRESR